MAMAALMAGVVIAHTGTELIHTMGYRLTLCFGVPHGRANAMLIPHVVRLYSPCDVIGWLCKSLGGKWVPDRRTGSFIAAEMEELNADIGIEESLGRRISDEELDVLAQGVVSEERKMANCCRRPTKEEVRAIFAAVIA